MVTTTQGFLVPPPLVALTAALAQRALSSEPTPSAARRLAALAVGAAAVGMLGAAAGGFRRRGTTVNPIKLGGSTTLVADGPFALTRNPMYVGLTGVLVAHALWRGSVLALLPAAAFVTVIDRLQIPPEEQSMTELFGAEYVAYRAQVPRWLGPLG